jgi:hypothetical protein
LAIPKILGAQRDFSAGELDEAMKRADENPLMKIGARQASNLRILSGGAVTNRPGRTVLFAETGRVEEILMSPGNIFYLIFGNGYLRIRNAAGTQVFTSTKKGDGATNIPWTSATAKNISFVIAAGSQLSIYIAYGDDAPLNVPQVLMWDGVSQTSAWTLTTYAELIEGGGQKRTLFYRLSAQNVTMIPSAIQGTVTIVFSAAVLTAGMIGTRFRFCGRQLVLTAVTNSTTGTATVVEPLPPSQTLTLSGTIGQFNIGDEVKGSLSGANGIVITEPNSQIINFGSDPTGLFLVGDAVTGASSGATGVVTGVYSLGGGSSYGDAIAVTLSTSTLFDAGETVSGIHGGLLTTAVSGAALVVQLLQSAADLVPVFGAETIVGPSGSATSTSVGTGAPQAVAVWDQEVMNLYRGYPTSVFFDQNRLGLCNIPSVPSGIAWSSISSPTDMYVGALPSSAIFELAPTKVQVLFVVPGMESSEFVFTDKAIFYIPITVGNPLVPGSVAFNPLSSEGCMPNVQPQPAGQSILYMKAGGTQVAAVQTPGAYYRPHIVDNVSEYHSHLFTASPAIAIAIQSAPSQFEELYAFILLASGDCVVGRYAIKQGLLDVGPEGKPKIGWLPWLGHGPVKTDKWVSSQGGDVIFTSSYAPNGVPAVSVVERMDNTQYLDGAVSVNNLPAPLTPPGGKGPLYVFPGPNATVTLIDLGTRFMGTYNIDANGFIIPQNIDGENLASAQLVAGQPWNATLEPFVADAPPGQSSHQRMFKRRVSRMAIYVSNSTGFQMARLFSGPLTPTSPALGTVMNFRRVETWNQGDDPTQPPPLREEAQRWRPLGRSYDPRVCVIKDTPGPLLVHEFSAEATI